MPKVTVPLDEFNRTILYPSYTSVITDISNALDIPYGALLIMHRDSDLTKTCNINNARTTFKDNIPKTVSDRRLNITINENYNEEALNTTAIHALEHLPIFQDKETNVTVKPIYLTTDVEFEFKYTSPSKSEAERLRDDIRVKLSQYRNILYHDIEYDIIIPTVIEEFIADVHTNISRISNISLDTYFLNNSTKRIHQVTDMANSGNVRLAVKERQVRIIGYFDFTLPDKIEIDKENNNYTISFTYKFSFEVPKLFAIDYPIMIYNKLINSKYLTFSDYSHINSKEEYKRDLSYTSSLSALSRFESHRDLEYMLDIKQPINIPYIDEFSNKVLHKGYGVSYSILCEVDETDKRTLLDLKDLGDHYIDPQLLTFFKNVERQYMTTPYMSMIYIGLYQDDTYFDIDYLTIDENLIVKSVVDLNIKKPVRVLISIIMDIDLLNKEAVNRYKPYPDILSTLIRENLLTIRNYKNYYLDTSATDAGRYDFYRDILNYYNDNDELLHVVKILTAIRPTPIYEPFIAYIKNNDTRTYPNLVKTKALRLTDYLTPLLYSGGITKLDKLVKVADGVVTIDEAYYSSYLSRYSYDRYTGIDRANDSSFRDFIKNNYYGMKTYMTTYIIAGRK